MNEETKKLKAIVKELRSEAVWIGEDGDAACVAKTKEAALRKFKALMRGDVGDWEAKEMKLEDIGIGWLFLPERRDATEVDCECGCHTSESSDEEMKKFGCDICKDSHVPSDEYEWFVSYKRQSPYEVWVYQT